MLIARGVGGLWLLARLGLPYLLVLQARPLLFGLQRRLLPWMHARAARRLRAFILRHGGLLIKIGQYIASRPDVFPLAYVDALADLRDQVPARPLADLQGQLAAAYEGRLDDHLAVIEAEALAAASFGQVHAARLADGTRVAVKIQYPDLPAKVGIDLFLVRCAVRLLQPALPNWPLHDLAEEIARTSREELDYLHEGQAAERLAPGLARFGLRVPRVLWAHTRERVLVLEFATGTPLARLPASTLTPAERSWIAETVVDGFLHQLLDEGFFHADPHAGNLLFERVAGQPRLWLLDFGMTSRITRREAELYRRFLACLQRNDTDGMVEVLGAIGVVLPGADRAELRRIAREVYGQLGSLNPKTFKGSQRQRDLAARITAFLRRAEGIVFPRHTLLLSRATALVEGLCLDLVPDRNFLDIVRPRLGRFLSPFNQMRDAWEGLKAWAEDFRSLPDRLAEAARDRDRGGRDPALIAALVLVAALLLPPGPAQAWAVAGAGGALVLALLGRPRS